jgi:hypothetical protein
MQVSLFMEKKHQHILWNMQLLLAAAALVFQAALAVIIPAAAALAVC